MIKKAQLRKLIRSLIDAGGIRLVVTDEKIFDKIIDLLPRRDTLQQEVMLDPLTSYDPITSIGVRTLIFLSSESDPTEWLKGSSRSQLNVICGPGDLPVAGGYTKLADQDGAFSLSEIERHM